MPSLLKPNLDDGRTTLILGSLLLLFFCLVSAAIDRSGFYALWPLRLILDFVRDLGIAAMVGGIVSLSIERVSRERFQQEIASEIKNIERNVINSAYSKQYPVEYTKLIEDMLKKFNIFKSTLNVTIDISIPEAVLKDENGESLVHYTQTVSYWIHNMASVDEVFRPRLFVDNNIAGFPPRVSEWTIGEDRLDNREIDAVNDSAICHNSQNWYQFPREVSVGADKRLYVHSKVRSFRFCRDVTTWCGTTPADSIRFTINHPRNYIVYAQPKSLGRSQDMPYASDGERVTVEIFTPVLPYTTIELGWKPKRGNNASPQGTVVGTALPIESSAPMSGIEKEAVDGQ